MAHNQIQRAGKNESKTRSEKVTIPLASRLRCPPYGGDLPHAVCSSSPSVPFPFAVAIAMKTIKWFGDGGRPALARARVGAGGLRDSWHSGGSEKDLYDGPQRTKLMPWLALAQKRGSQGINFVRCGSS
jgi:hypothetical protein